MPRISGPGGIQPQEGDRRPQLATPVKAHMQLMSASESLTHVLQAVKPLVMAAQSSQKQQTTLLTPAQALHAQRLDELNQELEVLKQMSNLIQTKPSNYDSQMEQFLRPGESIADAEESVPQEIIQIQEKMRAVASANVLTQEIIPFTTNNLTNDGQIGR